MFAARINLPFSQRVKPMLIAGLLALSLMAGAGAATSQVGAAAPTSAVNAQTGAGGATLDPTGGVEDAKNNGTNKGKGATTKQPPVKCIHFSQTDWKNGF